MKRILEFHARMNQQGRPWTKEETQEHKIMNDELLKELNATLCPSHGTKTGRIGFFCPGQAGDHATVMSVLRYSDTLWPGKEIIFFTNFPNADNLRYSNVSEVRPYPWAGNGLPEGTPDFYPLLCTDNRLNKTEASKWELTKDLEDGYFGTPWMVATEKQDGIDYSNVSKMIFGVPDEWAWHPYLTWSDEEIANAKEFMSKLPPNRKNILLECFCGSGQNQYWEVAFTKKIMAECRAKLGAVNFIFASHKHKGGPNNEGLPNEMFIDEAGVVSAAHFTVRQAALLIDYCDLMICMSSGISVSTSAWGRKPVTKLQYCGSKKCSTVALSNGPIELITTDGKSKEVADKEFFEKLNGILETI